MMLGNLCWCMVLATAMQPFATTAPPESSVVFHLPFEDSPDAAIGDDAKAQLHEGQPEYAPGKRGRAMVAGDGKAYLSFDAANIPADEGTLEFWFKPLNWDGMSTDTFHVFVETDQDKKGHWFLVYKYYHAQNAAFIWEKGGSIFQRKISGWRGWVHFAVTWSPTGCRMYFNGVPTAISVPKDPPAKYVGRMKIGDRPWQFKRDEQTLIDELYIYNRAMEPEEITWAMKNTETRPAGKDVPPGLVPTKVHAKILPSAGKIVAQVRHRLDAETARTVTGRAELVGPTPIAAIPLTVTETTAEGTLSFKTLATGDYTLRVTFQDASGKTVDQAQDKFFCPANEWLGNTIGITDAPPPPFTPLRARADRFDCWGREYVLGASGLPRQITSAGAPLLSAPVRLRAVADGRAVEWKHARLDLKSSSAVAAQYEGQWKSTLGTLNWRAVAEYDGMLKYTLTLDPKPGSAVDKLELRFPLNKKHATLNVCRLSSGMSVGATPADVKAPGAEYWWFGSEDRGLLALCESDQAWDRIDRPDGFRIERSGDTVEAVWAFIDGRKPLTEPWTFTFGLSATPVKDTAGLRGRPSRILPMNRWVMPRPRNYTPVGVEDMLANEGMRDKMWGNFLTVWGGGEWWTYKQDWGRPKAYGDGMNKLAAKGLSVLTYMMPREIPESVPEWRFWSDEWTTGAKTGWTNDIWDSATCTKSWADFTVWLRMRNIRRYGLGGCYIDNGTPRTGRNLDVGLGYIRDGKLRPTTPYFGLREVLKRLYTAVKRYGAEKNKPTLIMTHVSSEWPVAYLGFMDNRLDGEQYMGPVRKERKLYHDLVPLDKWRALNLSTNVGSMPVFLPEFHKDDLATKTKTRQLLGLLMLHDMNGVWFSVDGQANDEAVYDMWRVQDDFGVHDAELLPYWSNHATIGGQTDTIKASLYRKPDGSMLVVVVNLAKESQTANLTIDLTNVKEVTDAETGKPIDVGPRGPKLDLAPMDYGLVRLR